MTLSYVIADDAAFMREIIKEIMTSTNSQYLGEAQDGEEAVSLVASTMPNLIFLDMVMPRLNGVEAARIIKSISPNTKIIGCSTIDKETLIEKAIEAGFDAYIKKPFTKDQILTAVYTAFPQLRGKAYG